MIKVSKRKSKLIRENQRKSKLIEQVFKMNRIMIGVLITLRDSSALDCLTAMSVYELADTELLYGICVNTIHKNVMKLLASGFIDKGFKDSRASTYFVTQKGLDILNKLKTGVIKVER